MHLRNGVKYNWHHQNFSGFKRLAMLLPSKVIKLFLHLSRSWAVLSSIGSSQFKLLFHSPWIINLLFNWNGASKPSGLYTLLNATRSPRRVAGLPSILIMNLKVSSWMFHFTTSTLSSGRIPRFKSLPFTPSFLYSSGIDFNTSVWLLENFVRLKPPFLHNDLNL